MDMVLMVVLAAVQVQVGLLEELAVEHLDKETEVVMAHLVMAVVAVVVLELLVVMVQMEMVEPD